MFSTKTQLQKRTPENGTDRENFLSLLVDEYLNSNSQDAKYQVLANLANFAYDPINYGYIRDIGVLDIFLYVLKNENSHKLLHFACAGICNLCIDPQNAEYVVSHGGIKPLLTLLKSSHSHTVADTITVLIYLYDDNTKTEINNPEFIQILHDMELSQDKRLANLATIFLQDIYGTK